MPELIKTLIVDDNPADARLIKEMLIDTGECDMTRLRHAMRLSEAVCEATEGSFDVILLDLTLPDSRGLDTFLSLQKRVRGVPVVVLTGLDDEKLAAAAVREGAQDYLVKGHVDAPMLLRAIRFSIERHRKLSERPGGLSASAPGPAGLRMIGESRSVKEVEGLIEVIANTFNTTVLIQGETGTGKGLAAKAIHLASSRRNNPFIELNCSAIPETLLESEMFGYEKGAFTDAKQSKKGLFELADGGTIFLDEIGDMDLKLQPKLLQFLEERTFRKVGGTRDMKVDLRVIAATNKELESLVSERRFREDLYYRLKVMVVNIPPLRDRREDIAPLAGYFLGLYAKGSPQTKLSPACLAPLAAYPWPGNIRELKNAIERAFILCGGGEILPDHLPGEVSGASAAAKEGLKGEEDAEMTLEEMERAYIKKVLARHGGNKSMAARVLGISRLTLRNKLKGFGVEGAE